MFVKQLVVVLFPAQCLQFRPSSPPNRRSSRRCREPRRDVGVYIFVIVSIDLMFHLRLVVVLREGEEEEVWEASRERRTPRRYRGRGKKKIKCL